MKQVKGRLPNSSALNWIRKGLCFEFILTQTRAESCSQNGLSIIFCFVFVYATSSAKLRQNG